MANAKNLSSGKLYSSVSASSTHLLVYVGEGGASTIQAVWPTAPFYITVMSPNPVAGASNSLDSEIMLVTAKSNDQVGNVDLTVTRAQRGTTAKAFNEGSIVTNGIYSEDTVFIDDPGTTETPSPWIDTDDIIDKSVTSDKIDWGSISMGISGNTSVSFTAPASGKLFLIGSASYTWGYGGGGVRCGYIKSSGSASINTVGSTVVYGGDTTARSIQTMAIVSMDNGQNITTTIGRIEGSNLGTNLTNFMHFYIFVPD